MSTLTVPRSLTDNTNPTEAQFDTMRTYLLNFFNTGNLDENNIAAGAMVWSSLTGAPDDSYLKFTSSIAIMGYVSASDYFKIQNTVGDVVWGLRVSSTLTDYMELDSTTGNLTTKGMPYINTSVGSQSTNLMNMLAMYRKPRLTYTSADIVTSEDNYASLSLVMGRDRLLTIYDTSMSLAVTANGAKSGDTGTAVSGLRNGETRTANRWYYIYAVEVQYGTQNSGVYAILVASSTAPTTANITTIDGYFGAGKWTYMGVIRNGYNDGTNTNVVVKFAYDGYGFIRFTEGTVDMEGMGVVMASTTGASNLEYTIVIGNAAAATLPEVATQVMFSGHREAHGFEMHYRAVATDENHMIATGCYHVASAATLTPCVHMRVPLLDGYKVVIVIGATSTDQRITVAGLLDHYV